MRDALWIIEKRNASGWLVFDGLQPETIFGMQAITGITEQEMASTIFRKLPNAVLKGTHIPQWPSCFDMQFVARRKTW